jgi:hypothetical protein
MSDERDVQTPEGIDVAVSALEREKQEYRARAASIVSRSRLLDIIKVDLPEHLHGEWVPNNNVSINEAKLQGMEIDTEHAAKSSLHSDGSGKAILGDCIFMIQPKWQHDILVEEGQKAYDRKHGIRGSDKSQVEEREYLNTNKSDGYINTFNESNAQNFEKTVNK